MKEFDTGMDPHNIQLNSVPLWFSFEGLHFDHCSQEAIKEISSSAGRFLKVDPPDGFPRLRKGYRARIDINVEEPIILGIEASTLTGEYVYVKFKPDKLSHPFCIKCLKTRHRSIACHDPPYVHPVGTLMAAQTPLAVVPEEQIGSGYSDFDDQETYDMLIVQTLSGNHNTIPVNLQGSEAIHVAPSLTNQVSREPSPLSHTKIYAQSNLPKDFPYGPGAPSPQVDLAPNKIPEVSPLDLTPIPTNPNPPTTPNPPTNPPEIPAHHHHPPPHFGTNSNPITINTSNNTPTFQPPPNNNPQHYLPPSTTMIPSLPNHQPSPTTGLLPPPHQLSLISNGKQPAHSQFTPRASETNKKHKPHTQLSPYITRSSASINQPIHNYNPQPSYINHDTNPTLLEQHNFTSSSLLNFVNSSFMSRYLSALSYTNSNLAPFPPGFESIRIEEQLHATGVQDIGHYFTGTTTGEIHNLQLVSPMLTGPPNFLQTNLEDQQVPYSTNYMTRTPNEITQQ
ncbi:hypothetical protein IFM89_014432 [Coptis chinensis]|uniref:DUF4283 domain-containing protein n=1 Tax=Coptis chinensis TaxID=261450 RepID=A0A835I4Y8_9MAGN|nr:hypothetical protein IFM89_014432 [Coptis chinensis]